jgi:hypothetical protein
VNWRSGGVNRLREGGNRQVGMKQVPGVCRLKTRVMSADVKRVEVGNWAETSGSGTELVEPAAVGRELE